MYIESVCQVAAGKKTDGINELIEYRGTVERGERDASSQLRVGGAAAAFRVSAAVYILICARAER